MDAAVALFSGEGSSDHLPTLACPKYLIPTETCKNSKLAMLPRDMQSLVDNSFLPLLRYYELWYDINDRRPLHLFDFAPVFAAVAHVNAEPEPLHWIECKCSLNEQSTLVLSSQTQADASSQQEGPLLVASRDISDRCAERYFAMLKKLCTENDE